MLYICDNREPVPTKVICDQQWRCEASWSHLWSE